MKAERQIKEWYAKQINENPDAFWGLMKLADKLGLKPKLVTFLGFLMSLVAAYFLAKGSFIIGGPLILITGCFDVLDGALARFQKQLTKSTIFFDGVIDRLSDAAFLIGLMFFCFQEKSYYCLSLVVVTLVASFLVSYIKGRAEALGICLDIGVFTRPIVITVLGFGLIVSVFWHPVFYIVIWTLAVGTFLTALHRLIIGLKELN